MDWISIDEMPLHLQDVLVYRDCGREMFVAFWHEGRQEWTLAHGDYDRAIYGVTHWMPIPAPPRAAA